MVQIPQSQLMTSYTHEVRLLKRIEAEHAHASLQLQKRADLGPAGSWSNETTPPVVNGNQNTVTLPKSGSALFFRLVGP